MNKISKIKLYHTEKQFILSVSVRGFYLYLLFNIQKDEKIFSSLFSLHIDRGETSMWRLLPS